MVDKLEFIDIEDEEPEVDPYIEYSLTSYPSDYTLSVLHEQWANKDIVVPDFQRGYVWNIEQASKLIESFLLGLPIPQVFFYVDDDNKFLVVDGQQRITSIAYYFDGYFGEEQGGTKKIFRLQGLPRQSPYGDKSFAELDTATQRKLRSAPLRAINIRQLRPEAESTSVYQIFERLNTGGTPLKSQEIRNAVFRGRLNETLKRLNSIPSWRKLLGKQGFDKHMRDIELLLRVFALTYFRNSYDGKMKVFLSNVMQNERSGTSAEASKFMNDFQKVSDALAENLPAGPFRRGGPINSAMLEAVFCASLTDIEKIHTADLAARFEQLKKNADFSNAISVSTNASDRVKTRFDIARSILFPST